MANEEAKRIPGYMIPEEQLPPHQRVAYPPGFPKGPFERVHYPRNPNDVSGAVEQSLELRKPVHGSKKPRNLLPGKTISSPFDG